VILTNQILNGNRKKKNCISKAHPTHPTPHWIGFTTPLHLFASLNIDVYSPFSQLAVSPLNETSRTYGKLQHHNILRAARRAQEDLHSPHYRLYVNPSSHPSIPACRVISCRRFGTSVISLTSNFPLQFMRSGVPHVNSSIQSLSS